MTTHKCPLWYCKLMVTDDQALCDSHWNGLPREIQHELGRAYVRGMTAETATTGLYKALAAADAYIQRVNAPVREPDPGRWERLVRYVRDRDELRARLREGAPKAPHLRLVP